MITAPRSRTLLLIALFTALGLAACGLLPGRPPAASTCAGVSTDIGPCGGAPTFVGASCEALAAEFGTALDRALLEVVRGPADVAGEGKSVRLIHAEVVVTTALTDRLIAIGLIETCSMPAFLDAAEAGFSDELKSEVGHAVFDGRPDVSYEEFLTGLARVMSGIGKAP